MPRVVVHNYIPGRTVGRFRATAAADNRAADGCSCNGSCDDCRRDRGSRDLSYTHADLSIDATYAKGPMGKTIRETRHYVVPNVLVDPRGYAPEPGAVAALLRKLPEHQRMISDGWKAIRAEGYFKREQRDLGKVL